jgi:TonB family protein
MRPLSLAPISGRRRPASELVRWTAPSLALHALLVVPSLIDRTPQASADDTRMHEVLFLAPLLPKSDPSPSPSEGDGAGGAPIGWTSIASLAEGDGTSAATVVGGSNGAGRATAQAQQDLAIPPSPDPASVGDEHIFQAVDVDREVVREADAVAPLYPEQLRTTGVQGGVTVRFVVDTAGRVEEGSLFVIGATHPLFAAAVRDAAPQMHFRPAVRSGRIVRQQVIQSFQFVLTATTAARDSAAPSTASAASATANAARP